MKTLLIMFFYHLVRSHNEDIIYDDPEWSSKIKTLGYGERGDGSDFHTIYATKDILDFHSLLKKFRKHNTDCAKCSEDYFVEESEEQPQCFKYLCSCCLHCFFITEIVSEKEFFEIRNYIKNLKNCMTVSQFKDLNSEKLINVSVDKIF